MKPNCPDRDLHAGAKIPYAMSHPSADVGVVVRHHAHVMAERRNYFHRYYAETKEGALSGVLDLWETV